MKWSRRSTMRLTAYESFDAGKPDRYSARDSGRYCSKYLRPDGAKTSFVTLLEAISRVTPRDPLTGRLKVVVRPVYVSTILSRRTGVTMGFLRFQRWVRMEWGPGASDGELLALYRRHREFASKNGNARSLLGAEVDEGRGERPRLGRAFMVPRSRGPVGLGRRLRRCHASSSPRSIAEDDPWECSLCPRRFLLLSLDPVG
jgi:hypothetical protein